MEVKRLRIESEEQKNAISNLVKKSIIQQQENSVPVKLEEQGRMVTDIITKTTRKAMQEKSKSKPTKKRGRPTIDKS